MKSPLFRLVLVVGAIALGAALSYFWSHSKTPAATQPVSAPLTAQPIAPAPTPTVVAPAPVTPKPASPQVAAAPAPTPNNVAIQDGKTIDFSSGKPVVKDDAQEKAIISKAEKEMDEAAKDVSFGPSPKPAAVPPSKP